MNLYSLVICLDSGCQNYEQLWLTVSLRGVFMANLTASLLKEGIHSGGSGLIRDSFHVLRLILDRIDNASTGEMLKDLYEDIPESHINFAKDCAKCLGKQVYEQIPFLNNECSPQIVEFEDPNEIIVDIKCGADHSCVLNRFGVVYMLYIYLQNCPFVSSYNL